MKINFAELNPDLDPGIRPYQLEYKRQVYEVLENNKSVMLQMPTATGKTRLFVSIVNDLLQAVPQDHPKILILAHRKELVHQTVKELRRKYQISCSVIMAQNSEDDEDSVQVASVLTLVNRLDQWASFNFDFIIVDEAHHVPAESYQTIIKSFPEAKLLGVTATPYRLSGEGFIRYFEKLIVSQPVKEFIKQDYLCDYEYYSIRDIDRLHKRIMKIRRLANDGDFLDKEMMDFMDKERILSRIVDTYLKYANGKKGIVYAINIEHCHHICKQFKNVGIRAEVVDFSTPPKLRDNLVKQFRAGEFNVLCNVNIFSEGFNCPDIEFIQLARPTKSLGLFLQQIGRGLRRSPETRKSKVIFLDNVGSYHQFGLPDADRDWVQYFNGYDSTNPPDESPIDNEGNAKVQYLQTFDEGDEDLGLIDTSVEDDEFRDFIEVVIENHKDAPDRGDAYRKFLERKYKPGTVKNYFGIIPIHIDTFFKTHISPNFPSIYRITNPTILKEILNKLKKNIEFNQQSPWHVDKYFDSFERYLVFASDYFIEINRTQEEKDAIIEAQKQKEMQSALVDCLNDIRRDVNSIIDFYMRKDEPIPMEVLDMVQDCRKAVKKYKQSLQ